MPSLISHYPEHIGMKPGAEDFPLMVLVQVSNICNSGCVHCWFNANPRLRSRFPNKFINPELLIKIIDEISQRTNPKPLLRITGTGEPMLMPGLTDLLVYGAGKRNLRLGLITNGSLITPKHSEALISAGVEAIECSVDAADKNTYESIRRGLIFEDVLKNIEHMRAFRDKIGAPTKILVSVVENTSLIDPKSVKAFWQDRVDNVIMRKYLTYGQLPALGYSNETYLPIEKRVPCPYPFERMAVMSTGQVTFCNFDVEDGYYMGDANHDCLAAIWKNKSFEDWRHLILERRFEEMPLCAKCEDWKYKSWSYNFFKVIDEARPRRGGASIVP